MEIKSQPTKLDISFDEENLIIKTRQKSYSWKLKEISKKLFHATESERNIFIISPSGYGIHWPLIDEDLSIKGLLALQS